MRYRFFLSAVACLVLLGGCLGKSTTLPAKFYVLESTSSSDSQRPAQAPLQDLIIGVGPVDLPEYLNRPQMVTRTSSNELQLAEFHRWAEPLNRNFPRVLAENLSILLSTDRVTAVPWTGSVPFDYQVAMEVTGLGGEFNGNAWLSARWAILGDKGKKVHVVRTSSFSEPLGTQNYEALATALSRMIASLSREIAGAIAAIPQ